MLTAFRMTERKAQTIPVYPKIIGIDYNQEPVNRPEGLEIWQWILCTEGSGELILNGQRSIVRPNDAFLLLASTPHSYRRISEDWIVQILGFAGGAVPKILQCIGTGESGVYRIADPEGFKRELEALLLKIQTGNPHAKDGFTEEVYHILLELSKEAIYGVSGETAGGDSIVDDTIRYMDEHYREDISLDMLAARVGKTPEYLCSIFKKETGQTIIRFLTNLRIARARTLLLRYPEKTASEVGAMCGFQSPSYFGKIFRKVMGMTPGQYRAGNI